jgi:hypothetical protein
MGPDAVSEPEPVFTPPPPEPNGFFPGINPEDFEDFDFGNMDFSNLGNMDFSNLPKPPSNLPNTSPPVPPVAAQAPYVAPVEPEPIYTPPPRFEMEDIIQNMPTPTAPAPGGRFNPDIQQVANGGGYTPTAPAQDPVIACTIKNHFLLRTNFVRNSIQLLTD